MPQIFYIFYFVIALFRFGFVYGTENCTLSFDTLQIDNFIYDNWKHLSLSEKVHYILDKYQIGNLQSEFAGLYGK